MPQRIFVSLIAGAALVACANGGAAPTPASSRQDQALQQRAAEQTAPIGPPPQSSAAEVAAEAENDQPPPPGAILVPGARQPTPLPPGDPRTVDARMADIRAWDRCILRAQAQMTDGQPGRLQESPEELCRRALGMAEREAIPVGD